MKLVSYARVSTERQNQQGYSLDAQHDIIRQYALRNSFDVVCQVSEIESGGAQLCYRDKLREALDLCKRKGYALAVLRSDRLSRDLSVLESVLSSRVALVVVELGGLVRDPMMIRINTVIAANELQMIRQRTKEGLARARKEGKILGNTTSLKAHRAAGSETMAQRYKDRREAVWVIIDPLLSSYNCNQIAKILNKNNTPGLDGGQWSCRSVQNLVKRCKTNK